MKRFYTLLLVCLLAVPCQSNSALDRWYAAANEAYFNNALPKDTVIRYGVLPNNVMGTTTRLPNGFQIDLSAKYNVAPATLQLTLFHEMCHVETWTTDFGHGLKWQACMHRLDMEGAFKELL